jgi:hypothetical protein
MKAKGKMVSRVVTLLLVMVMSMGMVLQVTAEGEQVKRYEVTGEFWAERHWSEPRLEFDTMILEEDSNWWSICFDIPEIGTYYIKQYYEELPHSNGWDRYHVVEVYLNSQLQEVEATGYDGYGMNNDGSMWLKRPITNRNGDWIMFTYGGGVVRDITNENIAIANGTYGGAGKATVETAFGSFNLGALPKTKINAIISNSTLDLSFQAKGQVYEVKANRIGIDSNGLATYVHSNDEQEWKITITPEGNLEGSLILSGDRGTMNFTMELVAK